MKRLLLILLCLPMIGFGQSWVGDGYGHYNNIYLYLIGWGDNSTIAYLNVERFEDATATGWEGDLENRYEIKLVVQDLKSDKILFSNLMDEFKDELGQNALSILPDCCDEHFTIDKDIFSEDCFLYFYSKKNLLLILFLKSIILRKAFNLFSTTMIIVNINLLKIQYAGEVRKSRIVLILILAIELLIILFIL
jgi:hypothetical protein